MFNLFLGLLLLNTAEEVLGTSSPDQHKVMQANIHAMIGIMYVNQIKMNTLGLVTRHMLTNNPVTLGTTILASSNG